ncbi:MAG: hypothetical protein JWP28_1512 [Phenylobacterium sp.]|nr:hypothetical protein [Phenylobacterium sp.]MDB5497481.1 hypothetical protein [Phenylobacterium sp.]
MAHSLKWIAAALGAGLVLPGPAWAQEAKPLSVVFNVGAATDYVFRGLSRTDGGAEIYGGLDTTLGAIGYAGLWLSNVELGNGKEAEYDLYGGVRPILGPVTLDLGFTYNGFTHSPAGRHEDYVEWKIAPSMPIGPATVGLAYFYSDDFLGKTGPANYLELNASMPIARTPFSVSGALGHQQVKGPLDYSTWNLGVGYALNSHIGFDLRYWDTDEHSFGSIYKSKVVLGVKATFP